MGGCESCASSRRKEVEKFLEDSMLKGDLLDLRRAIEEAEAMGVDSLQARQKYSNLEREDWQSPEHVHDIMKWAMGTQDVIILHNVITEISLSQPDHKDLQKARSKMREHQEELVLRMRRLARNRDVRGLCVALDRARYIGMPAEELAWAREVCQQLEGAKAVQPEAMFAGLERRPAPHHSR
mmetsp:Transcript_106278/g.317584  ORF Transcript_106278/g.317584 Transcript_106278/m.317584 type:complete len:182 (+) Transcript_106278:64-609(+)